MYRLERQELEREHGLNENTARDQALENTVHFTVALDSLDYTNRERRSAAPGETAQSMVDRFPVFNGRIKIGRTEMSTRPEIEAVVAQVPYQSLAQIVGVLDHRCNSAPVMNMYERSLGDFVRILENIIEAKMAAEVVQAVTPQRTAENAITQTVRNYHARRDVNAANIDEAMQALQQIHGPARAEGAKTGVGKDEVAAVLAAHGLASIFKAIFRKS